MHLGSPGGAEREKGVECLLKETMAENFPNLGRELGYPSS